MDSNTNSSAEFTPDGKPTNAPGVYEMKREGTTPVQIITQGGSEGYIQADALVRVGYKRVGELPSREELLHMGKVQQAKDKANDTARKIREEAEIKALEDEIIAEAKSDAAKSAAKSAK